MCGLFGVISTTDGKATGEVFASGLYVSGLRGIDSTGVVGITDNNILSIKSPQSPAEFLGRNDVDKLISTSNVLLGHTRKATHGAVNYENAHPFMVGLQSPIFVMHNGMINNHRSFGNNISDSKNLAEGIFSKGLKETLELATGAFAICVLDVDKELVYLARNTERPLWYQFSEDRKMLIYASEHQMIHLAATRNGVKLFESPKSVNSGEILSIDTISLQVTHDNFSPQPSWNDHQWFCGVEKYTEKYRKKDKNETKKPSQQLSSSDKAWESLNSYVSVFGFDQEFKSNQVVDVLFPTMSFVDYVKQLTSTNNPASILESTSWKPLRASPLLTYHGFDSTIEPFYSTKIFINLWLPLKLIYRILFDMLDIEIEEINKIGNLFDQRLKDEQFYQSPKGIGYTKYKIKLSSIDSMSPTVDKKDIHVIYGTSVSDVWKDYDIKHPQNVAITVFASTCD